MIRRRPAYMLVEILAVLLLVGAGLSLVTAALHSIRYAQRRITDSANRTALTEDFLRCLARDVRQGSTARIRTADSEDGHTELTIADASTTVMYKFFENRVERAASLDGTVAPKRWEAITATASVEGGGAKQADVVRATVFWHMTDRYDPRADRRFDVAVRCAGERYHDAD